MILLLKKKHIYRKNLYFINIKYYKKHFIYIKGLFGLLKIKLIWKNSIKFFQIQQKLNNWWFELNSGWIIILYLNGLGFKSIRKTTLLKKRYWRFIVGHGHVFQYLSPKNIILKTKKRYLCFFGFKKNQIIDITRKIKTFRIPDCYKGIGIKYPQEIIRLKEGKMR